MRDKLRSIPGFESGEKSKVLMFLTQSVFLGIFIGAFDITAHSLLLSSFDEKMLARGYVVSGIVGIILTSLYSWFHLRVQFRNLAIINLVVVSALTLFLWTSLILSTAKWISFIVFIMLGPLNILTLLGFWGTAYRLFPLSQRKRLSRYADTGLIIGIIIISFTIPLLLSFKLQSHNILFVSASSILIATILQSIITTLFGKALTNENQYPEKSQMRRSFPVVLREDPYIRTIIIFSVLSVLVLFFVQYSFMAVTREKYPAANDMAGFLGLFTGCLMIIILFIKMFVFPYLHHNHGIKINIILSPVLITAFTAVAIVVGLLLGYTLEAAGGFMLFYILLAISRLITKSLKDSLEYPYFMVLYYPVNRKFKPEFQPDMVNKVNEMAVVFSGLVLTGLGLISFIRLIHFSIFLFIVAMIWMFVAFRLFKEYRKFVIKATEKGEPNESVVDISNEKETLKNRFYAYINFRKDYFSLISGNYSVLNKISNKWYFEELINYAYTNKDINLLPALKKTALNTNLEEEVRHHSAEVAGILQIDSISVSSDNEKIKETIKILSSTRMPQTTEILRLLRDNSIESRKQAIYMIGKFRITDLISDVCGCLSIPGLAKDAFEVLKSFGAEIENDLIRFYLASSGNTKLSKTIIQLLGNTCSKETKGFLFSRLWSNSRQLKEIAVKCLIDCKFKASEEEKRRLHNLTSEVIGSIGWYLSAKICLERNNDNFLLEEINREIKRWYMFLFNILSITYNSDSVVSIRENVERATMESVTYALEITKVLVSDSIKQKLIFLLDDVSDEEKLMNLFQYFPAEIPDRKKLLEDIINRDYNLISLWTKACTLRSITKIEYYDMAETVTALLFSPEELIQEEAAWLISHSKPELYLSASARLPDSIKTRLDKIITGKADKNELLYEKVKFLSKYFTEIQEDEMLYLAGEMKYLKNFEKESLTLPEGYIIWILNGDNGTSEVHVVYYGKPDKLTGKNYEGYNFSYYYLPLFAVEEYYFRFPDKSFEILKYIDINEE